MEKIEKGTILEIKVPNIEKPIKAIVLDTIEHNILNREYFVTYILYSHNTLYKAKGIAWKNSEEYWEYSDLFDIAPIIEECKIFSIPEDI